MADTANSDNTQANNQTAKPLDASVQYSVGKIPVHSHDGTDSPRVNVSNLARFITSPAQGDIAYYDGNNWKSLSAGSTGALLASRGTAVTYLSQGTSGTFLQSQGSGTNPIWVSGGVQQSFTTNTRQTVAKGNAVIIGNGTNTYLGITNQTQNDSVYKTIGDPSNNWFGQSLIVENDVSAINSVTFWYKRGNAAGSELATVSVRNTTFSGGNFIPTGADLASGTVSFGANQNGTLQVIFSQTIPVNAGSWVALVVRGGSDVLAGSSVAYRNSGALGQILYSSTDAGSTWSTDSNKSLWFTTTETIADAGLIGLANTTGQVGPSTNGTSVAYANNFLGIAQQAAGTKTSVVVMVEGIDNNQSGLTVGTTCYLTSTDGLISNVPSGNYTRKVGMATGTTSMLIIHDNL